MEQLSIMIPEELGNLIRKRAANSFKNKSDVVREALMLGLGVSLADLTISDVVDRQVDLALKDHVKTYHNGDSPPPAALKMPAQTGTGRPYRLADNPQALATVKEMLEDKASVTEIAAAVGYSRSVIYDYIKKGL